MRTGYVSRSWASRYHARWLGEEREPDGPADRHMT
jgi:formate dehydrogenase subunit gamma